MKSTHTLRNKRAQRVRNSLRRAQNGRTRLTVFRSSRHIYAQVIDDAAGRTLCSASTADKDLRSTLKSGSNSVAAAAVGKLLAQRASEKKVGPVIFDRKFYLYHGRVKALADAAREGGMQF